MLFVQTSQPSTGPVGPRPKPAVPGHTSVHPLLKRGVSPGPVSLPVFSRKACERVKMKAPTPAK